MTDHCYYKRTNKPLPVVVQTYCIRVLVFQASRKTFLVALTEHNSMLVTPLLPFAVGSTRDEHQADGSDKKKTGVYGSSPIKQICTWRLLVTQYVLIQSSN